MKLFSYFLSCLLVLLFSIGSLSARNAELEKFKKTASPAVALVISMDKEGRHKCSSGFFVSPQGYLVTTIHVIDGSHQVFIKGYGWSKAVAATVVMCYPDVHVALLRPKVQLLDKYEYLGLLPPQSVSPGTQCLLLSGHDELNGLQYFRENALGGQTDPWQVLKHPLRSKFRMVALELLEPFPLLATGAPCFDRKGRVLGMASFFHDFSGQRPKMLFHVVPADYLRDLLACAAHPEIRDLHQDKAQELITVVHRAEKKAPLAYRVAALKRRRRLRQVVVQSVKSDNRQVLQKMREQKNKEQLTENSRTLPSDDKRFARLPERVQFLRTQHGWSYDTLKAIADERPQKGMSADQIIAMFGEPERIVEGGEKRANGQSYDVWEYKRPILLSFDGRGKLISIR